MDFEWDPAKRETNLRKHGIDFPDAIAIFWGVHAERVDDRFDYGEERIVAYGIVEGATIAVVYSLRNGTRRIISARKCTRAEERTLYEVLHGRF